MLFALVSAALAADPLILEGVEGLEDVPTVWAPVTNVDFADGLSMHGVLQQPPIEVVGAPNPVWEGSFIVLRDSFFPEIARSVKSIN